MSSERTPQQIIGDDAYTQLVFEGYVVTRPAPADLKARDRKRYKLIRKSLQNKGLLPAATDTGLVTVGFVPTEYCRQLDFQGLGISRLYKRESSSGQEPVCPRSQAVELLAGRDTVIEMQADSIDKLERKVQHWQERADKAEELLAEKDQHISELRSEIESLSAIVSTGIDDVAGASLDDLETALEAERAESERLRTYILRAEKAEADNAAKDARIKELEQELTDRKHGGRWSEMVEALEAKLAAAEKALEEIRTMDATHTHELRAVARAMLGGEPEGRKSEN